MSLLDQYGQPIRRAPQRIPAAPWLSNRRLDVWTHITPDRMAMLFRQADAGELSAVDELYSVLRRVDCHVECETTKRVQAVLRLEDQLAPASKSDLDNEICDFVRENLLNHPQFADVKATLNMSAMTGVAAVEPIWDAAALKIAEFRRLPLHRLTYTGHDGMLLDWPLLISDEQPLGVQLDPLNIVLHCGNSLSEHPTRQGAYRAIAYMVMLKHYCIKDWWAFGERYGIPMRLGKYDRGTSPDDRLSLFDAVRTLGSDGAAVISKDTEITLMEAANTANSASFFEVQNATCNAEISKAAIGATLTTEVGTKGGSRAAANTHLEVQQGLLIGDGRRLAGTIMQQLIRPLVRLHYGPAVALPQYSLTLVNQEDYEKKSKWLELAVDRVGISRKEYYRQYNLPAPEIDEEVIGGQGKQSAVRTVANKFIAAKRLPGEQEAEQAQDDLDRIADKAVKESEQERAQNMDKMTKAVRSAKGYAEALAKIENAANGLSGVKFEASLRSGVMESLLHGMQQAQKQAQKAKEKGNV